jgi:hypothetical protein
MLFCGDGFNKKSGCNGRFFVAIYAVGLTV